MAKRIKAVRGVWNLGVSGGLTVKYSVNYSVWDGDVQRGGHRRLGAGGRKGGTNGKGEERKRECSLLKGGEGETWRWGGKEGGKDGSGKEIYASALKKNLTVRCYLPNPHVTGTS